MKLITCPAVYVGDDEITLFIAGGISSCADWQTTVINMLQSTPDDIAVFNPRRPSFNIEDPNETDFQIEWEFAHLQCSDGILFWFPPETLCPISLYELGLYAGLDVPLFVGCDPAYKRQLDVVKQLSLIRPDVTVHDNHQTLVAEVLEWIDSIHK